jgi:hypothetical protein
LIKNKAVAFGFGERALYGRHATTPEPEWTRVPVGKLALHAAVKFSFPIPPRGGYRNETATWVKNP